MPGTWVEAFWRHDPAVNAPPRYRRACRYRAFIPDPLAKLRFALDADTVGSVSEAEAAIASLNAQAYPALVPLGRLLLRTESIASSRVEGLQLGVRELARAEARSSAGENVAPTAREILANIDAMQLAVDRAASTRDLTQAELVAIHTRLMATSATPRVSGRVRTEQNWIGGNDHNPCGAAFVPPPPEHVGRLLSDLCDAMNDDTLPPVVQAALAHAQFETIHPFLDGNGRTGRAIIHVILRRRGLAPAYVPPVSVILAARRKGYIAGLTEFRGDGVVRWIQRFAATASAAATLARSYLDEVRRLVDRWRALLARHDGPRADAAAWAIIDVLPAHPMITGPGAIAGSGRARAAVYEGLEQLERAGVLKPASTSRRNRVWEPVGLLPLLEALEAGRLPAAARR